MRRHSRDSHSDSGAIDSWAAGALFDRVQVGGGNLTLKNLAYLRQCRALHDVAHRLTSKIQLTTDGHSRARSSIW